MASGNPYNLSPQQRRDLQRAMEVYRSVAADAVEQAIEATTKLNETTRAVAENYRRALEPLMAGLQEAALHAQQRIQAAYPPNWPPTLKLDLHLLEEIGSADGIPIVYVPRAEIVQELVAATTAQERFEVIDARGDDIAEDCENALSAATHADLNDGPDLTVAAIKTYRDGHYEAAQTLAVAVCDTYLKAMFSTNGSKYSKIRESLEAKIEEHDVLYDALHIALPLGPAIRFLEEWHGDGATNAPSQLNRHVTSHFATRGHLHRLNATIAIMLASSLSVALNAISNASGTP